MHANAEVNVERGVPYGHGKLLDVYRPDPGGGPAPTVLLWHGAGPDERDALAPPAVDIAASREFAALLAEKGWPVRFEEQPVDHAGIIGAEYDPAAGRPRAATSPAAVAAGELSARMIAEAACVLRSG